MKVAFSSSKLILATVDAGMIIIHSSKRSYADFSAPMMKEYHGSMRLSPDVTPRPNNYQAMQGWH